MILFALTEEGVIVRDESTSSRSFSCTHFAWEDMMTCVIDAANADDLPTILALLEKSGLPQDGLSHHVSTRLVAREDQTIVGSVGLEPCDSVALLSCLVCAHCPPLSHKNVT